MKQEKRAQLYNDISLISFLVALFLAIASFFFRPQMWFFISGICAMLGVMKYADLAKDFTCDGNCRRGKVDLVSASVFTLAAVALLIMAITG